MKKPYKFLLFASPLLLVSGIFVFQKEGRPIEVNSPARSIASVSAPKKNMIFNRPIFKPKSVAVFKGKIIQHQQFRNRLPQSVSEEFQKDPLIKLTTGHVFLKNVKGINKSDYRLEMGEILQEGEHFIFFKSQNNQYLPVALSKSTNMIYPISSVVHIKGATPEIHSQLINDGFKQYYYHPPLKLLSLEATPNTVLKLYEQLSKQGLRVELEVLRPGNQAI